MKSTQAEVAHRYFFIRASLNSCFFHLLTKRKEANPAHNADAAKIIVLFKRFLLDCNVLFCIFKSWLGSWFGPVFPIQFLNYLQSKTTNLLALWANHSAMIKILSTSVFVPIVYAQDTTNLFQHLLLASNSSFDFASSDWILPRRCCVERTLSWPVWAKGHIDKVFSVGNNAFCRCQNHYMKH